MNVYVAGAWVEQWERARPMIARLRQAGFAITHDWTVAEQRRRPDGTPLVDSDISPAERAMHARNDLDGVLRADVVLLLAANEKGACGSWVEMGAALAAREFRNARWVEGEGPHYPLTLIVCGEKNRRTIFTELADRLCATDDDGFAAVVALRSVR
jgi:hypothetical protein